MALSSSPAPSPVAAPLLAAKDLGRRHPTTAGWLFQDIDLEIDAGDRMALVGPTGSGKSLILRALALLDPADQGEVLWRGKPIADTDVPAYRGRVLYLQQQSPVIEGTVEENLRLPFSLRRLGQAPFPRQRASELIESLGRDQAFLASPTSNLSGGERQLVALLRALLVAPTVLLLDEPSAALDPQATSTLERMIDSWYTQAPTERAFVWVSHHAEQANRVADRIVYLAHGRIEDTR